MRPKTLSASSVQVFEYCAARWTAEYYLRAGQPGGVAASLGTVCHTALETWVARCLHTDKSNEISLLEKIYTVAYDAMFPGDRSRYADGLSMMRRWYKRSHPLPHEVISTERKQSFMLPTSAGKIQFNYIWDRCDRLDKDTIEVVDYKSVSRPIQPEGLQDKIQARCYGLAAQIAFPEAKRIWVTFDLLRYDPVGVVFTRDQNVETWHYLKSVAERIIKTDGNNPPESLNPECRWCVRKQVCGALKKHAAVGGPLALSDPQEAARVRLELESARGGLSAAIAEIDTFLLDYMEREDLLEFETEDAKIKATTRRQREVDSQMVSRVIGPDLLKKYGTVGVTILDKMIKANELTDEQIEEVKALIRWKHSEPSIKIEPSNPIGGTP